jgi:hypothetical protein
MSEASLTLDELNQIAKQLARGQGRSVSEDEALTVVKWAEQCRVNAVNVAMLELVLKGKVVLKVTEDGELMFRADPACIAEDIIKEVEADLKKK